MVKININRKRVQETVAKVKANAARRTGAAVNWWRPTEGNNVCRIFAFNRGDTGEGAFVRELRVHQPPSGKPIICGRSTARDGTESKDCVHCDEARRIEDERGRDAAGRYRARPRYAFIVVPIRTGGAVAAGEDRRAKVWQASKTVGEKILGLIVDEDIVDDPSDFFGCEGIDVKIKYDPNAKGAAMYSVSSLDSRKAKTLDASLQEAAQKCDLYADMSLEPQWFMGDAAEEKKPKAEPSFDEKPEPEGQGDLDAAIDRLNKDGLDGEYEAVLVDNEDGEPTVCYYPLADGDEAEGSWDYPEVVKPDRETRVEAAKKRLKPRTGSKKRTPQPDRDNRDDAEE